MILVQKERSSIYLYFPYLINTGVDQSNKLLIHKYIVLNQLIYSNVYDDDDDAVITSMFTGDCYAFENNKAGMSYRFS